MPVQVEMERLPFVAERGDGVPEGLVIPARHTATPMVDRPRHPGALLELGFGALTATLMAGFPLGVARRALDELVRLAPHKRRGDAPTTVAHDPHAQLRIGQAEATIQSARAFVLDTVGAAWEADHISSELVQPVPNGSRAGGT